MVLVVNMGFGALSGLKPLLPEGSALATAQVACVLSLQLIMSFVCFCFLPDADRIVSRFAGCQFLFEGLSTAALLTAERMEGLAADAPELAADAPELAAGTSLPSVQLQLTGFVLSLVAMGVPIVQLLEQRAVTPTINLIRTRGGNPLALFAAAYMLAASLPRKLAMLVARTEDSGLDATGAAESASADAGDEAVVDQQHGGAGLEGSEVEVGEQEEEEEEEERREGSQEGSNKEPGVGLTGDTAAMTGVGVSRLLARAFAAKEAASKKMPSLAKVAPSQPQPDHVSHEVGESSMAAIGAAARLRRHQQQRHAAPQIVDEDDQDDQDEDQQDGGGDDDVDDDGGD